MVPWRVDGSVANYRTNEIREVKLWHVAKLSKKQYGTNRSSGCSVGHPFRKNLWWDIDEARCCGQRQKGYLQYLRFLHEGCVRSFVGRNLQKKSRPFVPLFFLAAVMLVAGATMI